MSLLPPFQIDAAVAAMNACRTLKSLSIVLAMSGVCPQVALGNPDHLARAATDVSAVHYLKRRQRVEIEPGRKLNLFCMGHGKPTILLNAGLGDSSLA